MDKRKRGDENGESPDFLKKQKLEDENLRKLTPEQLPEAPDVQGLTLYELERKPLPKCEDDSTIVLELKDLDTVFTCPVCLGIIKETRTMMECLHRFCADCISKSLRLGKRECPTCRVKCSSQRNLRRDTNFDKLIATLYPNLEEYEAQEEKKIQKITEIYYGQQNLIKGMEYQGKQRQVGSKKRGRKKKPEDDQPTSSSFQQTSSSSLRSSKNEKTTPSSSSLASSMEKTPSKEEKKKNPPSQKPNSSSPPAKTSKVPPPEPTDMAFMLVVHPLEKRYEQISNKFLRSSSLLTVRHLTKFLGAKLKESDLQVFRLRVSEKGAPLGDEVSLGIAKNLWKEQNAESANTGEFVLYYSHVDTKVD